MDLFAYLLNLLVWFLLGFAFECVIVCLFARFPVSLRSCLFYCLLIIYFLLIVTLYLLGTFIRLLAIELTCLSAYKMIYLTFNSFPSKMRALVHYAGIIGRTIPVGFFTKNCVEQFFLQLHVV